MPRQPASLLAAALQREHSTALPVQPTELEEAARRCCLPLQRVPLCEKVYYLACFLSSFFCSLSKTSFANSALVSADTSTFGGSSWRLGILLDQRLICCCCLCC